MNYKKKLLKKELKRHKIIKTSKLGEAHIHCSDAKKYYNLYLDLLTKNQFSFINKKKYLRSLKN